MNTKHNPPTKHELTVEELVDVCVANGHLAAEDVNVALALHEKNADRRSFFGFLARTSLHRMLMRGELTLCSSTHRTRAVGEPCQHGVHS